MVWLCAAASLQLVHTYRVPAAAPGWGSVRPTRSGADYEIDNVPSLYAVPLSITFNPAGDVASVIGT